MERESKEKFGGKEGSICDRSKEKVEIDRYFSRKMEKSRKVLT